MLATDVSRPISLSSEWYLEVLACPECSGSFARRKEVLFCRACGFEAASTRNADLRPRERRTVLLDVPLLFDVARELAKIEMGRPKVTFKGPVGTRDATELLSVLQQMVNNPGRVLDLGCGPRDQATPIESLGHKYVGVDHTGAEADLRADAHALPFQSASFDFVFSYAVLEHLHNPFIALQEIKRVLKPGGVFVGTVSQGEPFHNSFFHHTSWGVLSLVCGSGMEVLRLWPCWDTLSGLAEMGRYPRVLRYGIRTIDWIHRRFRFLAPRKMGWSTQEKLTDELHRAASLGFVIRKRYEQ